MYFASQVQLAKQLKHAGQRNMLQI